MTRLRLLFVKQSQSWPRASGHDVHGFHMMQALEARGHAVSLACAIPPTEQALAGLKLEQNHVLESSRDAESGESRPPLPRLRVAANPWTSWQRRFTDYFGLREELAASLESILERESFDAVIVVARHLLPLLSVVKHGIRVWYPADDPTWHHITRLKLLHPGSWGEVRRAFSNALFERAFRRCVDRVWVVSAADRRAMRMISGCRKVDLLPNGVDAEHYRPHPCETIPDSCCFWGRLDFGPNVDALAWFLRSVWPVVKAARPTASFHLFGFNPTAEVRKLAESPGVKLFPDLPDLRSEVTRRQVVVLPFISGGGIKNKLLEAAALGMPIVCTAKALSGTKGKPAMALANRPSDWIEALTGLWSHAAARAALGSAAREWVVANHTWEAAARTAEAALGTT